MKKEVRDIKKVQKLIYKCIFYHSSSLIQDLSVVHKKKWSTEQNSHLGHSEPK